MPAHMLQVTNTADSRAFDVVPHWYMYPPKGCYTRVRATKNYWTLNSPDCPDQSTFMCIFPFAT